MTKGNHSHTSHPLVDAMVSIIIPSIILMKFSGENNLGAGGALVLALAFPFSLGAFELLKYKKFNFIALLGLASVLLTGGIGLFKIDARWLAVKEALIPGIIGVAVWISARTGHPLVRALLHNPNVLNIEKIQKKLCENNAIEVFDARLVRATYLLGCTFFFSSAMNYILAKWIVVSSSGSTAFNEELGRMTLLSYPMIVVPTMIMMGALFYYLWRTIRGLTGLTLEEVLAIKS